MFSKRLLQSALSFLIAVSLGCGLKLGEENNTARVAEVKGVSCLNNAIDDLKLFFTGDASDEQVGAAAECLQQVILTFKDNIRGKNKDSYTPGELASFLQNNFIKDGTKFTPELLAEVMKFKVLLFGGSTKVIEKTEIVAISSFIARFKPELVRLNPHMKVIVSKWTPETDAAAKENRFNAAKNAFNQLLVVFGKYIAATERSYEVGDLTTLLQELVKFTNKKSDVITTIENLKLFLLKTKLILIGGTSAITGQEWVTFHHTLAELYFQTLRINYFVTPLTPEQSDEKWLAYHRIADDITMLIPELLKAKGSDLLQNSDIAELLESVKAFAPALEINFELVNQVGKLKLVLLGKYENGADSWSQADFKRLNEMLPDLFTKVQTLVKNFKYLKFNSTGFRKNEIKLADFLGAEKVVNETVKALSEQLKYSYDLNDLKLLLVNAKPLLKDTITLPENLNDLFELAASGKVALTGEPGSALTIANLQLILNVGIQGYNNFVEFNNFVNPFTLDEPEFVAGLAPWVGKLKNTLEFELMQKPTHVILTNELTPVILAAQKGKFLTTHLQQKSLDLTFDVLWMYLLNKPEDRLNKVYLPGFNSLALENLVTETGYWIFVQRNVSEIFAKKAEYTKDELKSALQDRLAGSKSEVAQKSLQEMLRLLSAPGLMNFNSRGFLKILTDIAPLNGLYHIKDMSSSNLSRLITRIVIRAVAGDIKRVNALTGVTLDEVQFGYDQLKYLIFDLDLVDPKNPNFISGRFREANLFLAPSNGDEYASFEEFHHLVLHILSGIHRADSIKVLALQKCVKSQIQEIIAQTQFDSDCLLDLYLNETDSFLDMPEFLKIKTDKIADGSPKYSSEMNKTYYLSLLKAAGHVPNDNKTVFLGDANLFPHVVQYIEMIYYTHDKNRDGLLQKEEAFAAFPIFKSLIQLLAKPYTSVKEADLPGVFIYLLKNGKPPKTLADKLKFAQFVKDHVCTDAAGAPQPCMVGWDIASTRHDLGKIFNFIADATAALPPEPTPTPVPLTQDSIGH